MTGLLYDTGALIAAQRNDRRVWAIHRRALERRIVPVVPAGVLTEAWRGHDVTTDRFLAGTRTEPLTAPAARRAGYLLAGATAEPVDAMVTEAARRLGSAVLTSDYTDIEALAAAGGFRLNIIPV